MLCSSPRTRVTVSPASSSSAASSVTSAAAARVQRQQQREVKALRRLRAEQPGARHRPGDPAVGCALERIGDRHGGDGARGCAPGRRSPPRSCPAECADGRRHAPAPDRGRTAPAPPARQGRWPASWRPPPPGGCAPARPKPRRSAPLRRPAATASRGRAAPAPHVASPACRPACETAWACQRRTGCPCRRQPGWPRSACSNPCRRMQPASTDRQSSTSCHG